MAMIRDVDLFRTLEANAEALLNFEQPVLLGPGLDGHAVAFLEIAAGAKRLLAAAGENNGAQALEIDREGVEQFQQIEAHPRIERI